MSKETKPAEQKPEPQPESKPLPKGAYRTRHGNIVEEGSNPVPGTK
jgi:hypothetical protein